jgi:hypothetical protein
MSRYAADTQVSSDRSRAEIERILTRYGANAFAYGWQGQQAQVMFEMAGRRIVFRLPLPDKNAEEFRLTPSKKWERGEAEQEKAYEQAVRQRWRALALVIKAKLEAVEAGISTVESEFLAHVQLPSGATVGEWVGPQLDAVYGQGKMPALLPGSADG